MSSEHSEFREELQGDHPHNYDHTEPHYSVVAILGGITVGLLVVVGIAIQGYYYFTEDAAVQDKVLSQPGWALRDLRAQESWELSHYDNYNKAKGTVRLPIDQAMKLVEQESAANAMKYPSTPYAVKTAAQLAGGGAAAPADGTATPAAAAVQTNAQPGTQQGNTKTQAH